MTAQIKYYLQQIKPLSQGHQWIRRSKIKMLSTPIRPALALYSQIFEKSFVRDSSSALSNNITIDGVNGRTNKE